MTLALRIEDGGLIHAVTDKGPGIAEADHAAIFKRFRQAGDQLTAKPEGTGLGLPICRQILDHLGGRITLESRPGAERPSACTCPSRRRSRPQSRGFRCCLAVRLAP